MNQKQALFLASVLQTIQIGEIGKYFYAVGSDADYCKNPGRLEQFNRSLTGMKCQAYLHSSLVDQSLSLRNRSCWRTLCVSRVGSVALVETSDELDHTFARATQPTGDHSGHLYQGRVIDSIR